MKKILITGGSRGIGRACAELFSKEGYKVVFIYRNNDNAAKECEKKFKAIGLKGDLSIPSECDRLWNEAMEILDGIDVLINNAGLSLIGLCTETTVSDWKNVIDTNLSSAFHMSRKAAEIMINKKSGCIINIGSVWGRCGASCEVAYSASKAGIRGLTLSLAKELGPSNIRVNCIEPGVIDTDMNTSISNEIMCSLKDDTPLCRIGSPNDIAQAALFLASENASFITGQILGVDGGFAL